MLCLARWVTSVSIFAYTVIDSDTGDSIKITTPRLEESKFQPWNYVDFMKKVAPGSALRRFSRSQGR